MKILWRILANIYCFLRISGLNISPPLFLFNKPKCILDTKYHELIIADEAFTDTERIYILSAVADLEKFSNGLIKFSIKYEYELDEEIGPLDTILLRANSSDQEIIDSDNRIQSTTLGLCNSEKVIFIVHDRLQGPTIFRTTVIHELAHSIGLNHTDKKSIMHRYNFGDILYPNYIDAIEYARVFSCDPEDLIYFKSG